MSCNQQSACDGRWLLLGEELEWKHGGVLLWHAWLVHVRPFWLHDVQLLELVQRLCGVLLLELHVLLERLRDAQLSLVLELRDVQPSLLHVLVLELCGARLSLFYALLEQLRGVQLSLPHALLVLELRGVQPSLLHALVLELHGVQPF